MFPERVTSLVISLPHKKDPNDKDRKDFHKRLLALGDDAKLIKLADLIDSLTWMISIYEKKEQNKYPKFKNNDKYVSFL